MLDIDKSSHFAKRYAGGEKELKNKILGGIIINKFEMQGRVVFGGGKMGSKNLPTLYNMDKTVGCEVVECEPLLGSENSLFLESLGLIGLNYRRYLNIKNSDPNHVFNTLGVEVKAENGSIVSLSKDLQGQETEKMVQGFAKVIHTKLQELNSGKFSACSKVSLAIVCMDCKYGTLCDSQLQRIYAQETRNFDKQFHRVYYVTTDGIAMINTVNHSEVHAFCGDDLEKCIQEMKLILRIA